MKTKVAFIIALMVTLFAAVVYVGARPSESVTMNEAANIAAPEETQTSTSNAVTQAQANPKEGLELAAVDSADIVDLNEVDVYIVQLQDPPLALYAGGIDGLAATNAEANGQQKLDAKSADSIAYMDYLLAQQDIALANISSLLGHDVKAQYQYKASLNGFAVELSGAEAAAVAQMPDVRYIEPEGEYELQTDYGPAWMGATGIWDGSDTASGVGTYGEGIIVGVIDTGIDPWNPSFLDVGADGYDHTNPNGAGNYVGVCNPADPSYDATFPCNDKLIGAWGYASLPGTPRDSNGHGSHTSSTAAGNFVNNASITTPSGVYTANISGVAPHANIIMYAACCTGAALTAAKDQILLDGVDVVNYSIGSPSPTADPWNSADALQWLAARAAGIYVANSAGNDGPGDATLGAPSDVPWITSVGASSHNRTFLNSITINDGVQGPVTLDGWSLTGPLTTPVEIVFSSAYTLGGTISADDARLCKDGVFPAGTFTGQIVVCERGSYGRVAKGQTVLDGGAGGYILAQPDEFGGGPGSLAPDPHVLPAVHIDYYVYQDLLNYVTAAGANTVMGTIAGTTKDVNDAYGDVMASFSSRGANQPVPDMIVPSVTAPGRAIWAAYHQGAGGDGDYTYNVIQGTSMSGPHVAGAYALLKALHPTWTPAEVQSAIMTTARDTVLNDDGVNIATPFAQGSGHVDLAAAANAGFILDITEQEYQDANPAAGGQARELNVASLGNANCVGTCTWTRTFESSVPVTVTWTSSVTGVAGLALSVTPATFTLNPGATQVVAFEADVSAVPITTTWQFGDVTFSPDVTDTVDAHLPVAVVPSTGSLPSIVEINTRRDAGSQMAIGLETIEIPTMTVRTMGLVAPTITNFTVPQADVDTVSDFPDIFFAQAAGVIEFTDVVVPVGSMRFLAEIVNTTSPDLDMLVFHDANNNGTPELADVDLDNPNAACQSASGGSYEKCDIMNPVSGDWFVAVLNYDASATPPDAVELHTAVVSTDAGNMQVVAPPTTTAGVLFDVQIFYDEPALAAGDTWYGAFDIGTDPANAGNIGIVPVDVVRHDDDVTKTADVTGATLGQTVNYTITIDTNVTPEDMVYTITDTIPAGLTYVPGSISASQGVATEAGGVISWSDTMVSLATAPSSYRITTNSTDPMCDTGFGGYVDLAAFGINPQAGIVGDQGAWSTFSGQNPYSFFGVENTGLGFTSDGWGYHDSTVVFAANTALPNAANPNDILPMLWNDMEIFYGGSGDGVSLATAGPDVAILEYDDIQPSGGGAVIGDFEMVAFGGVDNTPGAYEVVFAYDNIGTLPASATVGLENVDGTDGVEYLYGNPAGVITDGLIVCFDSYVLGDPAVITYQATVDDPAAVSPLTNDVNHSVDNPGSMTDTASYDLDVLGEAEKTTSSTLVDPGDMLTYTIAITGGPGAQTYDVTDMIPSGFDFVSVDGATYVTATDSIEWSGILGTGVTSVTEGFEGAFPPSGWLRYELGAVDDPGFQHGDASSIGSNVDPHSGTYYAWHNDDNTTGDAISWLVSPSITVPAGAELTFWEADYYQTYYQYHGVWVSNADCDPNNGDFVEEWEVDGTETWTERTVDLSAYAGDTICFAFRYEGDFTDEWYIDDVSYAQAIVNPINHAITLTLQAIVPGTYTNTATIASQGASYDVSAPAVVIYGAIPTWGKTVSINGTSSDWATGPFTVYDGDTVEVVDTVSIDFNQTISYTLDDVWTDSLTFAGYDAPVGTVVTGTNAITWSYTGGISNTQYVFTKTFTVNDDNGLTDYITETLNVAGGGPALVRVVEFDLVPMEIAVNPTSLSSTQDANTQVTQTLTISNVGGTTLDWTIFEAPASALAQVLQPASEQAVDAREAPSVAGHSAPSHIASPLTTLLDEGFEGGVVPPTGWTQVITNSGQTWKLYDGASPHSGSYAAQVEYDFNQDEWLLSPEMTVSGGTLSLWSMGSVYWCRDNFDNCDMNVWLVVGAVGGGDDVYVGKTDTDWPANFTWVQSTFDLDGLTPSVPYKIGFQYLGDDGAQVVIDDILLDWNACDYPADVSWLSVDTSTGTVPSLSADTVNATLDSTGMSSGVYTANLCVSSNDLVNPMVTVPVSMTVNPTYGVDLSGNAAMNGAPGDVVTYTMTLTNTGNVSDDFTVTISDTWGATATPMTVTLAAGATGTFDVMVTIPAGAADADFDVAGIKVTSVGDPMEMDMADLTTTAVIGTRYIYLPIIMK